jgi:hypothetical protein
MPIIKELEIKNISPTNEEISVFSNCGVHYVFSEAGDLTVVDIYKTVEYAQDDFIGSLSMFMSEDMIPMVDLSFVSEKYRRQGHMFNLYQFVISMYGGLISDIQITKEANCLWDKLALIYDRTEERISEDGDLFSPTRYIIKE